jgi:hypothetical protein
VAVGLRKLSGKPTPFESAKPLDRAEHTSEQARGLSLEAEADISVVSPAQESPEVQLDSLGPAVGTDLKTPPSHDEFKIAVQDPGAAALSPESSAPTPANSVDRFMASLEALRATIRGSVAAAPATPVPMAASSPPVAEPVHLPRIEAEHTSVHEEITSVLEGMPLPPDIEGLASTPRPAYPKSPAVDRRKSKGAPNCPEPSAEPSLESALRAVRDAVPGLNLPTPPTSDTPIQGRPRPSSDGIPKSVSENLPKYPARPRMRTCNRCGHETRLRDAKCQKCSHFDESLGILDSLIAGDLARVEQVLLVRPHLITMRTSRHDWTLLHMAASGGNPRMVELLIEKGVSVNAVNRDGKTALHYAAAKGHAEIVQTLLSHLADPTMLYNGKSALDLAQKNGRTEAEDVLRNHSHAD